MFLGLRFSGQREELEEACTPTSVLCQCLLSGCEELRSGALYALASVSPDHPLLVAGSRPRFSICHFDSGKQVVLRVLMRSVFPLASGACHSSQFPKVPGASLAILMHASRTRRHGYDREST